MVVVIVVVVTAMRQHHRLGAVHGELCHLSGRQQGLIVPSGCV